MAETTITGLPNANLPLDGSERVPMDQTGATVDATTQDIANLFAANPLAEQVPLTVRNQTGVNIAKGVAVSFAGTVGASGRLLIKPAIADGSEPGYYFLGVTSEAINTGADGKVIAWGKVFNVNTNAFNEGDILWVNPAVPGGFTATEPQAPNLKLPAAAVVNKGTASGILMVRATTGSRLADLHDVEANGSKADGDVLAWDDAADRWEPKALTPADIGAATSAQGALADSAVQPGDLATVATSGDYDDLTGKPTLGTAAATDATDYATAAQGALADTATQPGDLAAVATSGAYSDLSGAPTIPTPGGSTTELQYRNSGAFGAVPHSSVDGATGAITLARLIAAANGAASTPPAVLTGTWFTGGTSTTTKPALLIEPTGATSTGWSTGGTGLGVNAPSGFTGRLLDLQLNGVSNFSVSSGGRVSFPLGSAAFPSLYPGADDNTGLWSPAADTLAWSTNGSEALRVDSLARVLIGATAAAQYNHFTNSLRIQLSGNVIGASIQQASFSNDAFGPGLYLTKSRNPAIGLNTIVQNNDILGTVFFNGADGVNYIRAAQISALVDGIPGAGDMPGRLVFSTTPDGATSPVERLAITASGAIQIADAGNIAVGATTGTKIGTATTQKLGFFNATPVVQPAEITDELTTITHTAPGAPDYAIQNLTNTNGFGFATADEGNTVLSVIANLQARVNDLESRLVSLGLLADAD